MNQREISELRRRFRPEKNAVSRIYGCYVNGGGEIVSYVDTPLGLLGEEEAEMYLGLLKKALGGVLGKNLIDIVFSTQQVAEGDEHRLLSDLRNSRLENADARGVFYQKVIENLELGENGYLILLASDSYDVPYRGKDGRRQEDASENVFTYLVCAICPIKDPSVSLRYDRDANEFHSSSTGQTVGNPALGFLFPAFDDRAANIYNALYYVQKPAAMHREFIDAVFHTDPPMSSEEQREAFHNVLMQALGEECGYDVLQTVHEQIRERIDGHREARDPEALILPPGAVRDMLGNAGVSPERLEAFDRAVADHFGENAALNPGNVIDSRRFEITTPEVRVLVDPSCSYIVESRIIDGRKYLLIPAGHDVTVNGVPVSEAPAVPADAASMVAGAAEGAEIPAETPPAPDGAAEMPETPSASASADAPPWD